jgi:hypothetical protein
LKNLGFGAKLYIKLLNSYPEFNQYIISSNYAPYTTIKKMAKKNSPSEVFSRPNTSGMINRNGSPTNLIEGRNFGQLVQNDK